MVFTRFKLPIVLSFSQKFIDITETLFFLSVGKITDLENKT